MTKTQSIALIAASAIFFLSVSCSNQVSKDLETKLQNFPFQMNDIYNLCDSTAEKKAIEFLYAYMPLGDMIDYTPQLYVSGVKTAFIARREMPWGKSVPEELFRHFVLPLRINNENLDNAREVFYQELKERVKGLSMYDAALEVNHWCHEKVVYTPSDGRTSAPLASVRTAYGRCGEESVFTATALRAVGIPARQVYTPRWAHTDDNHAWVEVWIDGKWYYLGACEPEPKLNVAWFSSTAQRGILMHTRVFGKYYGNEDVIERTDCYTEINVTANYAPVEKIFVKVIDEQGKAVKQAKVEYKIYNYAELYSAITLYTDNKGWSSATFGKGDIVVWASKGDRFGFEKVSIGNGINDITITLDKSAGNVIFRELDIVPPAEAKAEITLSESEITVNKARMAVEDSIRGAYTATFADMEDALALGYSHLNDRIFQYLKAARGNWQEISNYISQLDSSNLETGLDLLNLISEKDLRDTPSSILMDHLRNFKGDPTDKIQMQYVLNPRIANELLTPYRGVFQEMIAQGRFGDSNLSPTKIVEITGSIKLLDNYNPQRIPISPQGVMKLNAANRDSRDIFFVALCRSANIPARIEEISGKLQYYSDSSWHDVIYDNVSTTTKQSPTGELVLTYEGQHFIDDPKFEIHFTVAKIENGSIITQNFRNKEGYEGTVSWKSISRFPIILDCGYYMLTTGTRMASGKVLATISFFNITPDGTANVKLIMREDRKDLQVIGSMNAESRFTMITPSSGITPMTTKESSILECTGRGFFFLGFLKANHEPSNHAIRSLFEKEPNRPTILFYQNMGEYQKFLSGTFPTPPSGITFGIDNHNAIFSAIVREMKLQNVEYPLFVIADTFGRIVYISEGYNIGTAEQLGRIAK